MIKDINPPVVENIAIAVVLEKDDEENDVWNVYLINLKEEKIEGALVSSKGYGMHEDKKVKTSMLRHFLDELEPKSSKKIEPISEKVFGLNNEYWVSFYLNKVMYDKKFVFLTETIKKENFTQIPVMNVKGVLIK